MSVLLDTHVFLWAVSEPDRLSADTVALVQDPQTTLLISAASAWEIATKHRLGRLPMAAPIVADIDAVLARLRATLLPVTARHGILAGTLVWDHRDPFDRMLAAQSILENMPLITSDRAFDSLPGISLSPA